MMFAASHHEFLQQPRRTPAHHDDNGWRPTCAHDAVLQPAEDEVLLFHKEEEGTDHHGELQEVAGVRRQRREARGGAGGADRRGVPAAPLQYGEHQMVAEGGRRRCHRPRAGVQEHRLSGKWNFDLI